MSSIPQSLPRVEPGHAVGKMALPREEHVGVKDAVVPSEYPKHVHHPKVGFILAKDAEHEAALNAEIAALPPEPEPPVFTFGDECATLLKRDLTPAEHQFCNDVETAAEEAHRNGDPAFAPLDPDQEPDEVIQILHAAEVQQASDADLRRISALPAPGAVIDSSQLIDPPATAASAEFPLDARKFDEGPTGVPPVETATE